VTRLAILVTRLAILVTRLAVTQAAIRLAILVVTRLVMTRLAMTQAVTLAAILAAIRLVTLAVTRQVTILWPRQLHQVARHRLSVLVVLTKRVHSPAMTNSLRCTKKMLT
jgi:hypothetical protein